MKIYLQSLLSCLSSGCCHVTSIMIIVKMHVKCSGLLYLDCTPSFGLAYCCSSVAGEGKIKTEYFLSSINEKMCTILLLKHLEEHALKSQGN